MRNTTMINQGCSRYNAEGRLISSSSGVVQSALDDARSSRKLLENVMLANPGLTRVGERLRR